ncbi:bifunctional DNA primase/polymerase [Candidatus Peregrinibacteria bacterium]|nr:bifunctional DNA primase/polymerase [Candidatus Peregrinibacteria bacterium]
MTDKNYNDDNNSKMLDAALQYMKCGLSVIPCVLRFKDGNTEKADKKPLIPWKEFMNRRASEEEIRQWAKRFSNMQLGIVMGEISGNLFVIDIDEGADPELVKRLCIPPTLIVKTPRGSGSHCYLRAPAGIEIPSGSAIFGPGSAIDLRSTNSFAVVPPSTYPDGRQYEWMQEFRIEEIAEAPQSLIDKISRSTKRIDINSKKRALVEISRGVDEGERNGAAAQYIGKIIKGVSASKQESVCWPKVVQWNLKNRPPLEEDELRSVFDSITDIERGKRTNRGENLHTGKDGVDDMDDELSNVISKTDTVTSQLLDIVEEKKVEFFHDDMLESYAVIPNRGHNEVVLCSSKAFTMWLSHEYWKKTHLGISATPVKTAITTLEGRALFEGLEIPLNNRVYLDNEKKIIWYDLCDSGWRAVRIDHAGWQVVNNPPVIFKRYLHQKNQVDPVGGGDVRELLRFINVINKHDQDLLLIWLISCFISGFPHPILNVYGVQGSAKSFLCELLREIIDPSKIKRMSFPRPADFAQVCQHNHLVLFDNISYLSHDISDRLCRVVTGDGDEKRVHFSNDDDYLYFYRSCVILNGINLVGVKADLLERSILLNLERIPEERRMDEATILDSFGKLRPGILGSIFDILSKALAVYDTIKLDRSPRMCDFAKWGSAIAEAMGVGMSSFMLAYEKSNETQNEAALDESPVAQMIIKLMEARGEWIGEPAELLVALNLLFTSAMFPSLEKDRSWPKKANHLTKKINQVKPNLASIGLDIEEFKERGRRKIKIIKTSSSSSVSSELISDPTNLMPDFLSHDEYGSEHNPEQGRLLSDNDCSRAYREEQGM